MAAGLEAELSVVVDVFFPTYAVSATVKAFAEKFPFTPLRLFVEGLGAGYQPILDGRCSLGILGALPGVFPSLVSERLGEIPLVVVASKEHPLAQFSGRIPKSELAKYVQLVLTDRSELSAGRDYGVMSPATWRLADLSTKYAFLKDSVGWGSMPLHLVEQDIDIGALIVLEVDDMPRSGYPLAMSAVYQAAAPPGPAGRWFIDHLKGWSAGQSPSFETAVVDKCTK